MAVHYAGEPDLPGWATAVDAQIETAQADILARQTIVAADAAYAPIAQAATDAVVASRISQTATKAALDAAYAPVGVLSVPVVQATKSAAQTLSATSLPLAIIFDTELIDSDGMHSTTVNPSRLTCVRAGYYRVTGKYATSVVSPGPNYTLAAIAKNGTTLGYTSNSAAPAVGAYSRVRTGAIVQLAVNDYVELMATCSTASAPVSASDCMFEAEFIRP